MALVWLWLLCQTYNFFPYKSGKNARLSPDLSTDFLPDFFRCPSFSFVPVLNTQFVKETESYNFITIDFNSRSLKSSDAGSDGKFRQSLFIGMCYLRWKIVAFGRTETLLKYEIHVHRDSGESIF